MQNTIQQLRDKISSIYRETVQKVDDSAKENKKMVDVIKQTMTKLEKQRNINDEKFKILDLYLQERE